MDTQQQETQELWTDERIKATVHWHLSYNIGGITCLSETSAMALMREVRDDYQQQLAAVIAERDAAQAEVERCKRRISELEGEPVESEIKDDGYAGTVRWKGWKVDLYTGDEGGEA